MKFISNNTGITFFTNNRPVRVNRTDEKYARAVAIFDLPENEQDAALDKLINDKVNLPNSTADAVNAGFTIDGSTVTYQGEALPQVLANKVLALIEQNLPINLFVKFWDNLRQNPSFTAIRELYNFLEYKELPLTEDGCFLAYKGIQQDGWSVQGNPETRVIRGKVNDRGQIYNGIGDIIEIERQDVCDDRSIGCAPGIHVGSLSYAKGWASKVVVVKINPKDVVSVPSDCSCQKCRCSQYEVLSSFDNEIVAPVVDNNLQPVVDEKVTQILADEKAKADAAVGNFQDIVNRVKIYLKRKFNEDFDFVTVRQIQNSFSPSYPAKAVILEALTHAGYAFFKDEDGTYYVNL